MDQHKPRDGRAVEEIGYYAPNTAPPTVNVNKDRALYWLMTGAVPSETVGHLLKKAGVELEKKAAPAAESAPA